MRKRTEEALPCAPDVERFILGAVLIGQAGLIDTLCEEDFFSLPNIRIFRAMRDLHLAGKATDRVSVYHRLAADGFIEAVGGLSYLVSLDESMPPLFNAETHIETLREKSRLRTIVRFGEDVQNRALSGESSSDLLAAMQQMGTILSQSIEVKQPLRNAEAVVDDAGGVQEFLKPSRATGIDPPFAWLRDQGFRFAPKTLTTVAASTSVGKSSFLRSCCLHAAIRGHRVALFTPEVSADELFRACVGELGSVNMQRLRMGTASADEKEDAQAALTRLHENGRLWVCDAGTVTIPDVRQQLVKALNEGDPYDLLGLDFLQIMTPVGRFGNQNEALTSLSRGAKQIAQDMGIPVLLASQLSRAPNKDGTEPRPPQMSDLRGSGSIEENSDNVLLIHRTKANEQDPQWTLHVNLAKHKNGQTADQDMWFTRRYARFEEMAKVEAPPYIVNGASNGMIQRNWHDD